jgi:hypothetical protein
VSLPPAEIERRYRQAAAAWNGTLHSSEWGTHHILDGLPAPQFVRDGDAERIDQVALLLEAEARQNLKRVEALRNGAAVLRERLGEQLRQEGVTPIDSARKLPCGGEGATGGAA